MDVLRRRVVISRGDRNNLIIQTGERAGASWGWRTTKLKTVSPGVGFKWSPWMLGAKVSKCTLASRVQGHNDIQLRNS